MKLPVRSAEWALMRKAVPESALVANRVLPAVSRAAEGGVLWAAVGAGLAAVGGERGRRAAFEGALAVAAASGATNGPLKHLIGRHRPGTGVGRFVIRELGQAPRTPSMPSSHSAVAAAFATATGLALPASAAPLGAAAAVVAWSRVTAGRHYPSDVVAGVAFGCALGAAVHVVARRLRPSVEAWTPTQVRSEPSPSSP